jgi:hypothetical protein
MKSWIKKQLKSRAEFYKKHPEIEIKRIEAIRKKCKSAKERKEMSIKMKQVYFGKDTQKQVWKNKRLRARMSRITKLNYASNPEYRLKTSIAMKKVYSDIKLRNLISKKSKERYKNHPYLREKLAKEKREYYETHPKARKNLLEYFNKPHKKIKVNKELIVKSQGEKIIAETLIKNNISPNYESHELNFEEMDPIPDFYPDSFNIFIEFYGGHPKSWKNKVEKNILYKKYKIPVLALTPSYLKDINFEHNLLKDIKELSKSKEARKFKLSKWKL